MKIVFIGCVKSSERFLQAVYKNTEAEIIGIVTKNQSNINSDHVSLVPFAQKNIIDYLDFGNNAQMEEWIKNKAPDLIYCFGWSHILPMSILKIAKYGAIGFHPTLLPQNRGRHPIIWTLALGLNQTGSTFFYLEEDADAGDIVSQEIIEIVEDDDASTLYEKILNVGEHQVINMTNDFMNRSVMPIKQDSLKANVWRKRSKADGKIDWRMSTISILNLIKALTKPYVGAHFIYKDKEYRIWKAREVLEGQDISKNIEPGKVIAVCIEKNTFSVKTSDSILEVTQHDMEKLPKKGEYL